MVPRQEAIHVVIPTWRGRAHLAELLPSIAAQTLQPAQVLIVDGASNDGTQELAAQFGARFLDLGANLGFARAVNRGIAATTAPSIAVLNNDLRLAPDWLETLAATHAPFAVGKVLQWQNADFIDATWDLPSLSGVPMRSGYGQPDGAYWSQPRRVALAPWTAILLTRDYLLQTGPLDEAFGSYLEDVDIGLRGAELGLTGAYEPKAVAWHKGSSTLGPWHPHQVRLTSRNQLRLLRKHGGDGWNAFVGQSLWGLAAARNGCALPWLQGKWEGRRGAFNVPKPSSTLRALEQELFATTAATGFDRFWRCYWALT